MKYDENDNKRHLLVRVANSHTCVDVVHHENTFHKFGLFGERTHMPVWKCLGKKVPFLI